MDNTVAFVSEVTTTTGKETMVTIGIDVPMLTLIGEGESGGGLGGGAPGGCVCGGENGGELGGTNAATDNTSTGGRELTVVLGSE